MPDMPPEEVTPEYEAPTVVPLGSVDELTQSAPPPNSVTAPRGPAGATGPPD